MTSYKIYHEYYGHIADEIISFIAKNGFEYNEDEFFHEVNVGGKPSREKTKRIHITLFKNGKEQKKGLQAQVYNTSKKFELNMYIL